MIDFYLDKNIPLNEKMIKEIEIYDSSGKQLYIKNISETRKATIPNLASSHQVLFVKVITENGNSISKKVIF